MYCSFGRVYLKPGEIFFSDRHTVVNTVLGSCVSITMYVPRLKAGMISHCVLPTALGAIKRGEDAMKYVDCAILYMHKKMSGCGAEKRETEVKLFGGSAMFSVESETNGIGVKNVHAAESLLRSLGYCIMKSDTGGSYTRNLSFSLSNGIVNIKRTTVFQDETPVCSIRGRQFAIFPE
ncbi:chemotaxis protein CheD [Seleniivibrio woodruffii]|uniref:chemotaxis protein CheD n=1 Tax=Seleniivibrio woodruffii TaxID=1078050 RepID=UPI0026EB3F2B|nr:chemotaxis protein CheD [Seleniivibrio woodruffii]